MDVASPGELFSANERYIERWTVVPNARHSELLSMGLRANIFATDGKFATGREVIGWERNGEISSA